MFHFPSIVMSGPMVIPHITHSRRSKDQASTYETCNCMCIPPYTPQTSDMCYITHLYIKMSFRHAVYHMSQFNRFSNFNIIKNFAEKNTAINFIVYFTQMKALAFFFKTQKQAIANCSQFNQNIHI